MLIKLSDGCYVAADQIAEVRINDYADTIVVRTKDGMGHCHRAAYRQSIYEALGELVAKVNAASEKLPTP
jgi:hypothetical protein